MSNNIFVSYRRDDSAGHTGRLFDALRDRFGGESVFRDIDDLEPGVDFVDALDKALTKCDVLLVMIGQRWLSAEGPEGRRLDKSDDFVRMEVAKALERNVRVIPVLVAGATMPEVDALPENLRLLARRNAIELSDTRWSHDVGRLGDTLAKILKIPEGSSSAVPIHQAPAESSISDSPAAIRKSGSSLKVGGMIAGLIVLAVVIYNWYRSENTPAGIPASSVPPTQSQGDLVSGKTLPDQRLLRLGQLTWSLDDNNQQVDWNAAVSHCEHLTGAGVSHWRLPTIDELQSIYSSSTPDAFGNKILRPFHDGVRSNWIWSSTTESPGAMFVFDFKNGTPFPSEINYVGPHGLCVSD